MAQAVINGLLIGGVYALVSIGVTHARAERDADRDARDRANPLRLIAAAMLLLLCYLGIVFVSRVLADPEITLDERMLAPALACVEHG